MNRAQRHLALPGLGLAAYVPHPDLLTEKEVRRLEKTTYIYSWSFGKLGERTVVRK
jgi:hypothetical protein